MIELLGVGVARRRRGWLLRRVCVDLEAPCLTVVRSSDPDERNALLDVVSARVIPEEGRAWVDGVPVMRETRQRLRARVAEIDASVWSTERRAVAWNPARGVRALLKTLRTGRAYDRAESANPGIWFGRALASAVGQRPSHLLVRELDAGLRGNDLVAGGRALRRLVDTQRVSVLVGAAHDGSLLSIADRLLVIADARLVFDDHPAHASARLAAAAR